MDRKFMCIGCHTNTDVTTIVQIWNILEPYFFIVNDQSQAVSCAFPADNILPTSSYSNGWSAAFSNIYKWVFPTICFKSIVLENLVRSTAVNTGFIPTKFINITGKCEAILIN